MYIFFLMPQLTPFYFINEITFAVLLLAVLVFVLGKYLLPSNLRVFISRIFLA